MTLSETKEKFFRSFFARQRDISKQALVATATMAQANMEMILTSGLSNIAPKILTEVKEDVNIQGQLEEIKQSIQNVQKVANTNAEKLEEVKTIQEDMKLTQSSMRNNTENTV